jgi:calcium-dependent protein kinase
MGANCSNCHLQKPVAQASQETGDAPDAAGPSQASPGAASPFQPRAALKVKTGGFGAAALVLTNRGNFSDFYRIDEDDVLGEGTYSVVHKCTKIQSKQTFAVKTIQKKHMRRPNQFDNEFSILRVLDHPNILRMVESFEDDDTLFLVTELCEGGELFENIVDRGPTPEKGCATIITQILRAINYLHSNDIIHRDVKAENFFLAADDIPEKTTIKLGDFGLAKNFAAGDFCSTKAGTPYYVAPEVLEGHYTNKVDLWAAGVIFLHVVEWCTTFHRSEHPRYLRQSQEGRGQCEEDRTTNQ